MTETGILVPFMIGLPLQILGSISIRSSKLPMTIPPCVPAFALITMSILVGDQTVIISCLCRQHDKNKREIAAPSSLPGAWAQLLFDAFPSQVLLIKRLTVE
jgi:hypothetical protein